MITGKFRNKFPRVVLVLPGVSGDVSMEFIVDTAFEGDLKIPPHLVSNLDITYISGQLHALANGENRRYPVYTGDIEWADGTRSVDVLVSFRRQ